MVLNAFLLHMNFSRRALRVWWLTGRGLVTTNDRLSQLRSSAIAPVRRLPPPPPPPSGFVRRFPAGRGKRVGEPPCGEACDDSRKAEGFPEAERQ
ncbi:hypothetical protein ABVT39_020860 [Epinephelus coioides]